MTNSFRGFVFPDAKVWWFVFGPKRPSGLYVCLEPSIRIDIMLFGWAIGIGFTPSIRRLKDFDLLYDTSDEWRTNPFNEGAVKELLELMWQQQRGMPPPEV